MWRLIPVLRRVALPLAAAGVILRFGLHPVPAISGDDAAAIDAGAIPSRGSLPSEVEAAAASNSSDLHPIAAWGVEVAETVDAPRRGPHAASVIQTGLATWYGPGFEGQITKCGQPFHTAEYTASSNDLPCGAVIQVTNRGNGRSVVVTVTDGGGFQHPTILDLSLAAFSALAPPDAGVLPVNVASLTP